MRYRGHFIKLVPKRSQNLWVLEIEKGDYCNTYTVENNQTLYKVQEFACNQIDKLITEEVRSWT